MVGGEEMELQEALSKIVELQEQLTEKENKITSLTNVVKQKETEFDDLKAINQRLQDYNMNLFLKVSQEVEEPQQEEAEVNTMPETPTTWDDFMNGW